MKKLRGAALISAATSVSRVLGLVREQLFAALLGAGPLADAFNVAYRVPNLLRALFAEGALSSAFVPVFARARKEDGDAGAYRFAAIVAGDLVVATGAIVLLGIVFAPQLVGAMARSFDVDQLRVSTLLARIMLPFLSLVSLAAITMGMLNAQDRYGAPAIAPALFNVASISVGVSLYVAGVSGEWVAIGWALGALGGGLAQLLVQLPSLWRLGWRPRLAFDLRLKDPRVRRVALAMAPAVVGIAAVQVNVFVNTVFASSEHGAVSWLNYAFRFLQLPIGVFGVAIGTVSTTRYAEAAADDDTAAMSSHLADALSAIFLLCVPATVGLVVLDRPIIRLVYQHGHFSADDTAAVAAALDCFAVGLVAYAAVKVLAPAFYAAQRTRVAVYASIAAVVVNVGLNAALHARYGYRVLALDTAIGAVVNVAILYIGCTRGVAPLPHKRLALRLLRILASSAVMGAAVYGARVWLEGDRVIEVVVPVLLGAAIYAGLEARSLAAFRKT